MGFTLAGTLRDHASQRAGAPMLTYGDTTWSWLEFDERASRVAQGLIAEGVGPQQHVAFLDKNGPEFFDVLFGAGKANAIPVAVNWRLAPPEISAVVNDAAAKVLVVGPEFVPALDAIVDQLETVTKILVVGDHPTHESFEAWVARHPADDPMVPVDPDDVALQIYTSGTTGLPKGVMLTSTNLGSLLPTTTKEWGFTPDSVNLVTMPLFHIAGSGWALVGMYNGCHSVLLRDVDPAEILRVMPEHRVTKTLFVPAVLQFLLMTPGVDQTDFSALETIVYGASPITSAVLVKSVRTFGCDFIQVYGLTETTGAVTILRADQHDPEGRPERLRSCGVPFQTAELRAVGADGSDVAIGEVGEIWIRSPQVMKGYWNKPDDTAKTITPEGWFRTGDAGYLDDEGFMYLHDRVKDMIVSGGENVYPAEVENVLHDHPGVADVGVIGVPDERWGEAVKAIVVKAAGVEVTPEELVAYAKERLAGYKVPKSIDFAEALPRNPSGKILKRELREPYWAGRERRIG